VSGYNTSIWLSYEENVFKNKKPLSEDFPSFQYGLYCSNESKITNLPHENEPLGYISYSLPSTLEKTTSLWITNDGCEIAEELETFLSLRFIAEVGRLVLG
jgi:hypothetical protein